MKIERMRVSPFLIATNKAMRQAIEPLRVVAIHADTAPSELLMGIYALTWGIYVLLPTNAFAISPIGYALLRRVPEPVLGTVAFAIGAGQLWATCYGSVCDRRRWIRIICWWYMMMFCVFASTHWGLAEAFYAEYSLVCCWLVWRLSLEKCVCGKHPTPKHGVPTPVAHVSSVDSIQEED